MEKAQKIIPVASEPENLIELAEAYGVDCNNIVFSQVYSLEPEELEHIPKPVVSIFFVFPIGEPEGAIEKRHKDDVDPSTYLNNPEKIPFFAHQVIGNLCGTMAMIHSIANSIPAVSIKKGSWIDKFITATKDKTPAERGVYIAESNDLLELHNKNALKSDVPVLDEKCDTHFTCFIINDGVLWELDGRKPYPINHGPCDDILKKFIAIVHEDFFANLSDDDALRISILTMSKKT